MSENLMDGLLSEITRVSEIEKEYREVPGGAGKLAAWSMQQDITAAKKAISEGDTVEMIRMYKALKEYEL